MNKNCKLCNGSYDFRMAYIKEYAGEAVIVLSGHTNQVNNQNAFKYCPECGSKLTEENFKEHRILV